MKIKTTQIIKKLMPNSKKFRVRVKNQRKLSEELVRRLWWKFEVIEYCDNKEEFDSSVLKIKGYFDWRDSRCLRFPPKKYIPKNLPLVDKLKPLFHIIRLKENRFKVVKIKNKH